MIILKVLEEVNIDFLINGELINCLVYVLNFYLKGIFSDLFLMYLDLRGIVILIGLVCIVGIVDFLYVLIVMYGENFLVIKELIWISFGYGNILEEIVIFFEVLVVVI